MCLSEPPVHFNEGVECRVTVRTEQRGAGRDPIKRDSISVSQYTGVISRSGLLVIRNKMK